MPQIANQDYNVIDFYVLPYYEAVERLFRAYQQGTVFDCVVIKPAENGKGMFTFIDILEADEANTKGIIFLTLRDQNAYIEKAPLVEYDGGFAINIDDGKVVIVSADGFKLKPVVQDGVLTGVEVTTEKVENNAPAQYFKEWMIGQPVTQGV